jgi:hypothetical protein
MNVATLQQFLRSLIPALQSSEAGPRLAQNLERASGALEPFSALDLDAFAGFLGRCEEYRRSGAVTAPSALDLNAVEQPARKLDRALERLGTSEGDLSAELVEAQRELSDGLTRLARSAGLRARLRPDAKWADEQLRQGRIRGHARAVVALASRITEPAAFEQPDIQSELRRLETEVAPTEWKQLSGEFGVPVTRRGPKALRAILLKLTGQRAPKTRRVREPRASSTLDAAKVGQFASDLTALLERGNGADQLSEAEVDTQLNKLEALSASELVAIARQAGIEKPGKSKGEVLNTVRARLTAARRPAEEARV